MYILVYLFDNAYQMILFNNTTILWILNTEFSSLGLGWVIGEWMKLSDR